MKRCFNCGSTQHLARNCNREKTQMGGIRQSVHALNTGGPRGGGRGSSQQPRGGMPRGIVTRSVPTVTLANAEVSGLQLQENLNGYENGPPPPPTDGQYLGQEYLHEQYPNDMEPNDNLMRRNAYRVEVQSAASTDLKRKK